MEIEIISSDNETLQKAIHSLNKEFGVVIKPLEKLNSQPSLLVELDNVYNIRKYNSHLYTFFDDTKIILTK